MKTFTKTGRKVIGALVTAAIVFSALPAMFLFADAEPKTKTLTVTPTASISGGGNTTIEGITVTANTRNYGIHIGRNSKYFEVPKNNASSFTFSINARGAYAGYNIRKIEIVDASGTAIQSTSWANYVWTGSGTDTSATLTLTGTNNNQQHRVDFSAIKVYVEKPLTSVTMGNMNFTVGDSASAMSVTLNPSNSTYSVSDLTFTSSSESVATVAVSGSSVMVTPVGVGTATISASYGNTALGQATVTVYSADDLIVNISPSTLRLAPDGDTATLSYSVSGATDHDWEFYGYTSNDSDIAYVYESTGEVESGELGQTTITVWIYDYTADKFVTADCTVTVSNDPEPSDEPSYTPEQLQRMATENFVERLYIVCLNRTYDVTGRDAWTDQLMAGGSATAVVQGFIGSPEFIGKNLSNEEFVTILYKVFFDRTPDAAGLNNWVSVLNSGTYSRAQVVNGFAQSPEWASYCARYSLNV
jgi:hypothetical protein